MYMELLPALAAYTITLVWFGVGVALFHKRFPDVAIWLGLFAVIVFALPVFALPITWVLLLLTLQGLVSFGLFQTTSVQRLVFSRRVYRMQRSQFKNTGTTPWQGA